MPDLEQREVGWLVTAEDSEVESGSRVGWGQLRIHAGETEQSYERGIGRTIFMDKSLTEHMIPEGERVRWIAHYDDDDGEFAYRGIVRVTWLFDEDDLAYNIDRFCIEDVGATCVYYSVEDIITCALHSNQATWEQFARNHTSHTQLHDIEGIWIQIYC